MSERLSALSTLDNSALILIDPTRRGYSILRQSEAPETVAPVMFTTYYPKLSETFVLELVRSLARTTDALRVVSLLPSPDGEKMDAVDREVAERTLAGPPLDAAPSKDVYRRLPWWVAELLLTQPSRIYDVESVVTKLTATLSRPNGVLHVHFLSPPGTMGALVAERGGWPAILELHGYDVFRIGRSVPEASGEVLTRFDRIIVNSNYMRKAVEGLIPAAKRSLGAAISLIPPGVNLAKIDDVRREPKAEPGTTITLVSVGRLIEKKGHRVVLDAVAIMAAKQPDLRLHIIGDGPQEPELRARARELGIAAKVVFHGAQAHRSALRLMRSADLFVLACREASNGDLDSTPAAILEAQALGVPVISTRVGGVPEILVEGRTGLLVPPDSPGALAKAVMALSREVGRRRQMGTEGAEHTRKMFGMEQRARKIGEIYGELVSNARESRNQ